MEAALTERLSASFAVCWFGESVPISLPSVVRNWMAEMYWLSCAAMLMSLRPAGSLEKNIWVTAGASLSTVTSVSHAAPLPRPV